MGKKQISILVDEEVLARIDADARRVGRSRNWVIRVKLGGENFGEGAYGDSGAGVAVSKKIADILAGGESVELGGDSEALPGLGKAQDDLAEENIADTPELRRLRGGFLVERDIRMVAANLPDGIACGHPGCLNDASHPCEGCGRIGGRRPIYNMEDNAAEKNRAENVPPDPANMLDAKFAIFKTEIPIEEAKHRWKFPECSEERMQKMGEEEPGGLMACSPEILAEMLEAAKIDGGVAATLHLAGVKLDREILIRWGLVENYKPKLETVSGIEGQGKAGKVGGAGRRTAPAVSKDANGAQAPSVGIGKPVVDMQKLRDICVGNISVTSSASELHEVDLCGFKSYNEVDGENYVCGKEKHGPKVKHGEWIKI